MSSENGDDITGGGEETLFEFPCTFPIKAMGRSIIGMEQTIVEIVRVHTAEVDVVSVRTRLSAGGKYIGVTVTITARSKAQLDAIYMDLTSHPDVLMSY
jgi:putative lipoic acid-binding regulatory protein